MAERIFIQQFDGCGILKNLLRPVFQFCANLDILDIESEVSEKWKALMICYSFHLGEVFLLYLKSSLWPHI